MSDAYTVRVERIRAGIERLNDQKEVATQAVLAIFITQPRHTLTKSFKQTGTLAAPTDPKIAAEMFCRALQGFEKLYPEAFQIAMDRLSKAGT